MSDDTAGKGVLNEHIQGFYAQVLPLPEEDKKNAFCVTYTNLPTK
jgi:hypothetical protein